jgi:hypothetical protein
MMMKRRWAEWLVGPVLFAAAATGCDADGKICESGEGAETVESRYQACNRSCTDKDNKAACAKSVLLAADVCKETKRKNSSACAKACDNGDEASCGE